jgi:hypothetical protein
MPGIRIGAAPQPVPVRAGLILTGTPPAGLAKFQVWLERIAASAAPVFGQQLPNVLVALLAPMAGVALVMGLWRLTADLGWTETFFITGGFFSHWQVWIALSIALKILSSALLAWTGRIGKIPEET